MSASINDLFTAVENGGAPQPTTVTSIRTPGATSLAVASTVQWPTVTAVHFVTGTPTVDTLGNAIIDPTTLCLWKGIVSGSSIVDMVLRDSPGGTDPGNAINDIVQMAPDSAWAEDFFLAATAEHDTEGHHTDITPTSVTTPTLDVTSTATFPNGSVNVEALHNPVKFFALNNANQSLANNAKMAFNTKLFDTGSNFDNVTNNRFTAPVAGFYLFSAVVYCQSNGSASPAGFNFYKNGAQYARGGLGYNGSADQAPAGTIVMQLAAGDYVEIFTVFGGGGPLVVVGQSTDPTTWFCGHLVSVT